MVAKILAYERTPDVSDTCWYHRRTTVFADTDDDDAWLYWEDFRYAATKAGTNGYLGIDSLASSHGRSATSVVQSMNNGTSFVRYRGTTGVNWVGPFAVNPSLTANGTRFPVICSFTCQTVALNRYDTMTGDAWLKVGTPQNLKGPVAFIGNTHNGMNVTLSRSAITGGHFDGLFAPGALQSRRLRHIVLAGRLPAYELFHDSLEYLDFNLLGDPEMNLRAATPTVLSAKHDPLIPTGLQNFEVTVSSGNEPLADAFVSLRPDSQVYLTGKLFPSATGLAPSIYLIRALDAEGVRELCF